jgi:site-specific recombinase XerD
MKPEILDYLRYIRIKNADTTCQRKLNQLGMFYKYLDSKKMHYLTVAKPDVETWLLSRKYTQQSRRMMCGVIAEFYDYLRRYQPEQCPEKNPAADIDTGHYPRLKLCKGVPGITDVKRIFDRAAETGGEFTLRNRVMLELAYGSGLRRGELARLNVEDVNFEESTAVVLRAKGNKCRTVPLTAKALESIREYLVERKASRGPMFVSYAGRRMHPASIYYTMRNKLGIRPHLLRHACASHLVQNGCSTRVVQELLGHALLTSTQLYTHFNKEKLRDVIGEKHPRAGSLKTGLPGGVQAETVDEEL